MPSRKITDLYGPLQTIAAEFIALNSQIGTKAFLTCTYRSNDEQAAEYAKGRDTHGNVIDLHAVTTEEKPGHSAHNVAYPDGRAAAMGFDFALYGDDGMHLDWNPRDQRWQDAVAIGEKLGLLSGGHWQTLHDWPHMELIGWRNIKLV